jgi:hypothetical protein
LMVEKRNNFTFGLCRNQSNARHAAISLTFVWRRMP